MKQIIAPLLCLLAVSASAGDPVYLDQRWTDEDRQWFYTTPQGSKMVPYSWAMALEVPLEAAADVGTGSIPGRAWDAAGELLYGLFRAGVQKL